VLGRRYWAMLPAISLGVSPLVVTGCGCQTELHTRVTPSARTIAVGEKFTAKVQFLGCGGTEPLSDAVTWTAADTLVATVHPTTGVVTGRRAGTTVVTPRGATYGEANGIVVTVR